MVCQVQYISQSSGAVKHGTFFSGSLLAKVGGGGCMFLGTL